MCGFQRRGYGTEQRPLLHVRWKLRRRPPSLGEWLKRARGHIVVIERRAERLLVRLSGGGSCRPKKTPFPGLGRTPSFSHMFFQKLFSGSPTSQQKSKNPAVVPCHQYKQGTQWLSNNSHQIVARCNIVSNVCFRSQRDRHARSTNAQVWPQTR